MILSLLNMRDRLSLKSKIIPSIILFSQIHESLRIDWFNIDRWKINQCSSWLKGDLIRGIINIFHSFINNELLKFRSSNLLVNSIHGSLDSILNHRILSSRNQSWGESTTLPGLSSLPKFRFEVLESIILNLLCNRLGICSQTLEGFLICFNFKAAIMGIVDLLNNLRMDG